MSTSRRNFLKQAIQLSLAAGTASLVGCSSNPKKQSHTGVVLDPLFFKHNMASHPENANRLKAIDEELQNRNLWDHLTPIAGRYATQEELLWVHHPSYVEEIDLLSEGDGDYYDPYKGDTYLNAYSYDAARMAAGSAINLNLAVYDRKIQNGFALLRPPGHHALVNQAMGFCIFNSDVIAAKALQKYRGVKKVAIIDFDVHHGNGTQDLTIDDPNIMAISIHQHPFWPMTGGAEHLGNGDAKGSNINIPLGSGAGNSAYLNSYDEIIHPKLEAFQPEQIIVFAGYDAHWLDPLAEHQLSVSGFNRLLEKIKDTAQTLCQGRLALSLGGGYNLEPLAKCVAGNFEVLLNLPQQQDNLGETPLEENLYTKQLNKLKKIHLES